MAEATIQDHMRDLIFLNKTLTKFKKKKKKYTICEAKKV